MPTADKDLATMFMSFAGHCMGVIPRPAPLATAACELGKAEVAAVRPLRPPAALRHCSAVTYTVRTLLLLRAVAALRATLLPVSYAWRHAERRHHRRQRRAATTRTIRGDQRPAVRHHDAHDCLGLRGHGHDRQDDLGGLAADLGMDPTKAYGWFIMQLVLAILSC